MKDVVSGQKPPCPFNPGSPVDPHDFVGRSLELENFRQKLGQTANGSLASMAVAGGYGIGKTSFLHKCKTIAEEHGALTIFLSLNEIDDFTRESLARELIKRIREKVNEEVILKRISHEALKLIQLVRLRTESGLELGISTESNYPNLQSALSASWKALKNSKKAIVFLIDEARVLEKNRADLILYLRAVLEQLQIDHTPVMIIPAGKLTISGPSGTGFSPLVRTFPPVILENFNIEESRAYIIKKLSQASIKINEHLIKKIFETTEGHPYVLAAYMTSAYSKLQTGEQELTEAHFKAADLDFTDRVLGKFFERFYDGTDNNSNKILRFFAKQPHWKVTLPELLDSLHQESNKISPYLGKLVQDGAILRIERGKYTLFHHLLGKYIQEKTKDI